MQNALFYVGLFSKIKRVWTEEMSIIKYHFYQVVLTKQLSKSTTIGTQSSKQTTNTKHDAEDCLCGQWIWQPPERSCNELTVCIRRTTMLLVYLAMIL